MLTANERRIEIMRILIARRFETQGHLAQEFSVSIRTIQTDLLALSAIYPIESSKGYGGGVSIPEWYHPHHHYLTREQQKVLEQIIPLVNDKQREVIHDIIVAFGLSPKRK